MVKKIFLNTRCIYFGINITLVMCGHNDLLFLNSCQLVVSADILCEQFGPRLGLAKCRAWYRFNLFDTLMVFHKEYFEKIDFKKIDFEKKISRRWKSMKNYPVAKDFAWFGSVRPSQQLLSCRKGQFTWRHFFSWASLSKQLTSTSCTYYCL